MATCTMACGEDVHTRYSVVDNRHVAVDNPVDGCRKVPQIAPVEQGKPPFCDVPPIRRPTDPRTRPGESVRGSWCHTANRV